MKPTQLKSKNPRVDFTRSVPFQFPERRYGGCGILNTPTPYSGPAVLEFAGIKHRGVTVVPHFQAVRLERSPTGSCHGSFRIDELGTDRRGNPIAITLGYHCSWPDRDVCLRLRRQHADRIQRRIDL